MYLPELKGQDPHSSRAFLGPQERFDFCFNMEESWEMRSPEKNGDLKIYNSSLLRKEQLLNGHEGEIVFSTVVSKVKNKLSKSPE